jgi:hypothetical protein
MVHGVLTSSQLIEKNYKVENYKVNGSPGHRPPPRSTQCVRDLITNALAFRLPCQ